MITDGNLISKGVNEGEAIALQPWQADPNIVSQAIAAGREKKKEKEAEEKAQKKQMEDFQAQLLEDYKYNPLDAKAIKKFQDEAVEAIKNYRPGDDPLELKLKIQRLKIAKNDSYNTFVEGNKMMQQINKEKDSNYIEGLDDWTKSQVENDAADLDAFGANIAKREAARLGVYAGQKKIDNIDLAIAQNANTITKSEERAVQSKGTGGTIITKKEFDYDPEEVRRASDRYYDSHKKAMEEYNLDKDALYQLHEDKLKTMGGISITKQTAPRSSKSGGWTIGSGSATNGNLTISAPVEYDIREKSIDKEYENYLKTASRSGSETFTKNEYRDWYNKTRPAQKGLFYPLTSTRQAGEYPAIDVELSDGSHINASPVAQNEDGTQLLVKTKSGDFITAPTDKNQTFYNKHKTSSGQVSQITQNWGNDDIQISATGGTGAAPTTKQEVAKGNAKNAAAKNVTVSNVANPTFDFEGKNRYANYGFTHSNEFVSQEELDKFDSLTEEEKKKYATRLYEKKYYPVVKDLPVPLQITAGDFNFNSENPYPSLMVAAGIITPKEKVSLYTKENGRTLRNYKVSEADKKKIIDAYNKNPNAFLDAFDAERKRSYSGTSGASQENIEEWNRRVDETRAAANKYVTAPSAPKQAAPKATPAKSATAKTKVVGGYTMPINATPKYSAKTGKLIGYELPNGEKYKF